MFEGDAVIVEKKREKKDHLLKRGVNYWYQMLTIVAGTSNVSNCWQLLTFGANTNC